MAASAAGGGRRRHGEGSWVKLPSGRYLLQVSLGIGPDGKRLRRAVTGRTLKEVYAKRDALLARQRERSLPPSAAAERLTLGDYLTGWLERKRPAVVLSSWLQYDRAVKHVVPRIGGLRLVDVAPEDVGALYAALSRQLAPQTVLHVHRTLSQAMKRAVLERRLPRNPCEGVSPGRVPRGDVRALTGEEVRRLLDVATGDWRLLWLLGLTTGMRLGELLGLAWSDVDLDAGTVTVRQVLVDDDDGMPVVRPEPKTKSSRRTIPLPPETVEALRSHSPRQKAERVRASIWVERDNLVFRSRRGTPLRANNTIRALKHDALAAGVVLRRSEGAHLLRHTFASTLLAAGRPVTEVAMLMGHASPATLLDVYAHWIRSDLSAAREALRRHYGLG